MFAYGEGCMRVSVSVSESVVVFSMYIYLIFCIDYFVKCYCLYSYSIKTALDLINTCTWLPVLFMVYGSIKTYFFCASSSINN